MSTAYQSLAAIRRPTASKHAAMAWLLATIPILSLVAFAAYWGQSEYLARDDVFFRNAENGTFSLAVASYGNGRFLPGFVYHLLAFVGWEIHTFWHLIAPAAYVSLAVFAYAFVSGLTDRIAPIDKLLCAAIIVLFPFSINLIINKNNLINFIFSYLAILAAIQFFRRKESNYSQVLCGVFVFLAAASYQTSIYYFLVFVCAYSLFNGGTWSDIRQSLTRGGLTLVVGLAAYMLFFKLVSVPLVSAFAAHTDGQLLEHYAGKRAEFNDLGGFFGAAALYLITVFRVLILPEPILSLNLKLLALAVFASSFLLWSRTKSEQPAGSAVNRRHYTTTGVLVLLLLLLLGSPIHLLINDEWIAPRVLVHAGAAWAVLMVLAIQFVPSKLRHLVRICIAGYVLGLGLSTADAVQGSTQLYKHDLQLAARIVGDLEAADGFDETKPVAVVGRINRETPYATLRTERYYDIQVSNFDSDWSKDAILEETSGLRFAHPSAEFREASEERCRLHRPLDGYYKTIITGEGAIVCLVDLEDREEISDP